MWEYTGFFSTTFISDLEIKELICMKNVIKPKLMMHYSKSQIISKIQ